jgi:hypothetical protein
MAMAIHMVATTTEAMEGTDSATVTKNGSRTHTEAHESVGASATALRLKIQSGCSSCLHPMWMKATLLA